MFMDVFRSAASALFLFSAPGLLALGTAPAALAQDDRHAATCAEAEESYREMFGHPSSDEDMPVVLMYRNVFCPAEKTVKQGTSLRWRNVERRTSHSIWFRDADRPESERIFPGESIEMEVDLPIGDHVYLCGPHWERRNMIGRLTVVEQ
ncbi:MAG: copper-binding protein [Gemmobacter sp.]